MDRPWGHYAKWNKSAETNTIWCHLNAESWKTKHKLKEKEIRFVVIRSGRCQGRHIWRKVVKLLQPKCASTDEWIKKRWCVCIQWNTIQPQKEWNDAMYSNMDGPRGYHKWSKSVRYRYHMILLLCGIWKTGNKLTSFIKQRLRDIGKKLMVTKGERWKGRIN